MRAKRFRKDDASIAIEAEDVDIAVERDRKLVPLVRIVRQTCEKPIDLLCKALAACIERRSIERGVAVDAPGIAIALEHGSEWGRDRHARLGIDLVGEGGDKAVHPLRSSLAGTLRHLQQPRYGAGLLWDCMGLHGSQRALRAQLREILPRGDRNATAPPRQDGAGAGLAEEQRYAG